MEMNQSEIEVKQGFRARLLVVFALVLAGFMSTSFAKSERPATGQGSNCAANMKDLASHPESGKKCSPQVLKEKLKTYSGSLWQTEGFISLGVKFNVPGPEENFSISVAGSKKVGRICCDGGNWSIEGVGAIRPTTNGISVGSYKLIKSQQSSLMTPYKTAYAGGTR